jgi:hypothetical protein
MNTERIERALREGPPDEPAYVPGGFRGSSRPRWWLAVAGASVGLVALVVGVAIGLGLATLRGDIGSGPEPRTLVAADLEGVWESDPIAFADWVDAVRAEGFAPEDIDAFLEHDPFEDEVRYALLFFDGEFHVQAAYDGLPFQTLSGGTFGVDDPGVLHLVEVVDGAPIGCEITAAAEIDGEQISLRVLDLPGCDTNEQMANTLFFDIASYARRGGDR